MTLPSVEELARVIWTSDDEWNNLEKCQSLDVSADWGEWIATSVIEHFGTLASVSLEDRENRIASLLRQVGQLERELATHVAKIRNQKEEIKRLLAKEGVMPTETDTIRQESGGNSSESVTSPSSVAASAGGGEEPRADYGPSELLPEEGMATMKNAHRPDTREEK